MSYTGCQRHPSITCPSGGSFASTTPGQGYTEYKKCKKQYLEMKYGKEPEKMPYQDKKINYTGAGVILVEDDNLILFHNPKLYTYSELGGYIDDADHKHKDPIAFAAARECYQESCKLIEFSNTSHLDSHYIDYHINDIKCYRCYFIAVRPGLISMEDYQSNHDKLIKDKAPGFYLETDGFTKFPIEQLKYALDKSKNPKKALYIKTDESGERYFIRDRTKNILKIALADDKFIKNINNSILSFTRRNCDGYLTLESNETTN